MKKISRIGKINKKGQFDIVWESNKPIEPDPYPDYYTKEEWEKFLRKLYRKWKNNWVNVRSK